MLIGWCGCGAPQKKTEQAEYHKLLMSRLKEQRERRSESLAKVRVCILHRDIANGAPAESMQCMHQRFLFGVGSGSHI